MPYFSMHHIRMLAVSLQFDSWLLQGRLSSAATASPLQKWAFQVKLTCFRFASFVQDGGSLLTKSQLLCRLG